MMCEYNANSARSSAHFNLKNIMLPDVEGDFKSLSGTFIYDAAHLEKSSIDAEIDVNSMTTGDLERDNQLKSENFFNAEKYPRIIFHSKKIEAMDSDVLLVHGDLTVKDITNEVVLNVERPKKAEAKSFNLAASTLVNRIAYQLELGAILEVAEILVGNDIEITMNIQLVRN